MFWNINGSIVHKMSCLNFINLLKSFDIVILIETKLAEKSYLDLSYLGFSCVFRNDRTTSSGGVLVAAKTWLAPHINIFRNEAESEQIFLSVYNRFVLGGVYIPPVGSDYFSSFDRFSYLSDTISLIQEESKDFLIVGDFNGRFGNRKQKFVNVENDSVTSVPLVNSDKSVNSSGRRLLKICQELSATILTGLKWPGDLTCYTPSGASTVDTGICSCTMLDIIEKGKVHQLCSLSDHVPISFTVTVPTSAPLSIPKNSRKVVFRRSQISRVLGNPDLLNSFHGILLADKYILQVINRIEGLYESGTTLSKNDITSLVSELYQACEYCFEKFSPQKSRMVRSSPKKKDAPGCVRVAYDKPCVKARSSYYQAFRVFRRNRTPENYRVMKLRQKVKKTNERRCRRASERLYVESLFDPQNVQDLWKSVKPRKPTQYEGPITNLQYTAFLESIANGKFPYCTKSSESAFKVLTGLDAFCTLPQSVENDLLSSFPEKILLSLKNNKACGSDGWYAEFIKLLNPLMVRIVPKLFIFMFRSRCTPSLWDNDIKVPVPKPNKPLDKLSSLRPITLVNNMMKLYEKWFLHILDEYYKTSEEQAGFKKEYSCVSRLFVLHTVLDQYVIGNKTTVFAVFIDFSSFFDTVREEFLCEYLIKRGVPSFFVGSLHSMLSSVNASVHMKSECGDTFKCKVGLRQGSCLSPKLATAFLDQVTDMLKKHTKGILLGEKEFNHLFYADDLVIFFTDWQLLQTALNEFCILVKKLGLNVSVEKSYTTVFAKRAPKGIKPLMWDSEPLPIQKECLYLGCEFSSTVRYTPQLVRCKTKADKAFSILFNFQKRIPTLRFDQFLTLYNTLVMPILSYASEIFSWEIGPKLNSIYVDHLKRYLAVPKCTSTMAVHWITGTYPIEKSLWIQAYRFWGKMMSLGDDRLEKIALQHSNQNHLGWHKHMYAVFSTIGFSGDFSTWDARCIKQNQNRFTTCLTKHFDEQYEKWISDCSYRFLRATFPKCVLPWFMNEGGFHDRRILCRLLLNGFKFESITGVRHSIPFHERFCHKCVTGGFGVEIGDEVHYMTKCPYHASFRTDLITCLGIYSETIPALLCNPYQYPVAPQAIVKHLARFVRRSFCHLSDPLV